MRHEKHHHSGVAASDTCWVWSFSQVAGVIQTLITRSRSSPGRAQLSHSVGMSIGTDHSPGLPSHPDRNTWRRVTVDIGTDHGPGLPSHRVDVGDPVGDRWIEGDSGVRSGPAMWPGGCGVGACGA